MFYQFIIISQKLLKTTKRTVFIAMAHFICLCEIRIPINAFES